jgi:hypothetical protein
VRAFPENCAAVCYAIAGSGAAGRPACSDAHTIVILLKNFDIFKGYETVGEKGGRKAEEIDVSMNS